MWPRHSAAAMPRRRPRVNLRDPFGGRLSLPPANTAEGLLRKGKAGKDQLDIAFASAGEANAALRLSRLAGAEEQQAKLRRVGQMLWRLKR